MLTVLRDAKGRIELACEWFPVDDHGVKSNYGRYCFVNQVDISKTADGEDLLRRLIDVIATEHEELVGAYWERRDRTGTRLHAYRRDRLVRQLQKEEVSV